MLETGGTGSFRTMGCLRMKGLFFRDACSKDWVLHRGPVITCARIMSLVLPLILHVAMLATIIILPYFHCLAMMETDDDDG